MADPGGTAARNHARVLLASAMGISASFDIIDEAAVEGEVKDAAVAAVGAYVPHRVPEGFSLDEVAQVMRKVAEDGEDLTPRETFITEAIIIPDLRPAIDVVGGDFTIDHPAWPDYAAGTPAHARFVNAMPCVGRIELPGNPSIPFGGTGFVVGDGLLMTNRHVALLFAQGLGTRALRLIQGIDPGIDFLREVGGPEGVVLQFRAVRMIHPYWDLALIEVDGLDGVGPLTLGTVEPSSTAPRRMAVIGYPAFDPRNRTDVQNQVFRSVYNVKRLLPGLLNGRRTVDSFGKPVSSACHDSSTLGGNSGSVLLDAETGKVVGLHFAGLYKDSNFAVAACDMACDGRIIDAGVQIEGGGRRASGTWDAWWARADAAEAPTPTDPDRARGRATADVSGHRGFPHAGAAPRGSVWPKWWRRRCWRASRTPRRRWWRSSAPSSSARRWWWRSAPASGRTTRSRNRSS